MSKESSLVRGLLIFGLCVPLALFLGYQLATPDQKFSLLWIGLALCLLFVPLLLRWHHALLILTWNITIVAFFLPGRPDIGYLFAGASLAISIVRRTLSNRETFVGAPLVNYSLIFLAAVVLVTAHETGGIHANAFGSEMWGAMRYFGILGAIAGYFALVGQSIPTHRRNLMAGLFFLSGATAIVPALINNLAGDHFQFFLLFFESTVTSSDSAPGFAPFVQRFIGVSFFSQAVCYFMILRYGIRGIFDLHHPWRLLSFGVVFGLGLLGGFRSFIILTACIFLVQFYFEGLFRSRLFLWFIGTSVISAALLVGFADRLPLAVQRSISFLPVHVNPIAKQDAESTLDWRLAMWRDAIPLIPKYFLFGKGYGFDGTDYYLTSVEARRRGWASAHDAALISGGYHQGILTLIIPLGIWGVLGFAAFCWGSIRVLYSNYKNCSPEMKLTNTFLLSYFLARLFFYVFLYGEFHLDLMVFTGTVGLSLALNKGVQQKSAVKVTSTEVRPEIHTLQPAFRVRNV